MTGISTEDQAKISALCREAERLEEDALYSSKGHFNAEHQFGFEAASWYWHFVDVVWIGLFFFVYVL